MKSKKDGELYTGSSNDCITFLEERKTNDKNGVMAKTGQVVRTQKPFDFERDYFMFSNCLICYNDTLGCANIFAQSRGFSPSRQAS